jgi:hypothetical protein
MGEGGRVTGGGGEMRVRVIRSTAQRSALAVRRHEQRRTGPDGVDCVVLGELDDEIYIRVVVVVGAAGNLGHLVRHADELRIGKSILRCRHHNEANEAVLPERLVRPLPHRSDRLDGTNAIVRDQDLPDRGVTLVVCHELRNLVHRSHQCIGSLVTLTPSIMRYAE